MSNERNDVKPRDLKKEYAGKGLKKGFHLSDFFKEKSPEQYDPDNSSKNNKFLEENYLKSAYSNTKLNHH